MLQQTEINTLIIERKKNRTLKTENKPHRKNSKPKVEEIFFLLYFWCLPVRNFSPYSWTD